MGKMISAFGFAPYVLTDGVREMISEGDRKLRPVMSRGQVIAPLAFFAKALGAEIAEKDGKEILSVGGRTLMVREGETEYEADGVRGEYSVPVRRELGRVCLPIVETARALGLTAAQFGTLAVIAPEEDLAALTADEEKVEKLTRKTCGAYNAAYFTAEDFKQGRAAWRRDLCGDEKTNDLAVAGMERILEARDRESERLRTEMNREADAVILFGTEAPVESSDLKTQYDQVLRMALPYGTVGCRGYRSEELLSDILYALDWMHDNMYGAKVLADESFRSYRVFNWWEWFIGGACPMLDTVMIVAEEIGRELVDKYVLPMSFIRTQMRVELRPQLAMSRILSLTPLALLTEDRALLQAEYVDMELLLADHDSGNNMRRDWCYMGHGLPYNICYGMNNLNRVAKIINILSSSPLAYTIPGQYKLMMMARYTFAPCLYRGQGLNMMNGRMMQTRVGGPAAASILQGFKNLFGMFGEEEDQEISRIIRRNATPEVRDLLIGNYDGANPLEAYATGESMHIASYGHFRDALTNEAYDEEKPYTLGYMWYSGDSCVQFRNEYLIALRMNSERAPGYECINSANGDAWYTGDGMLYVYTPTAEDEYGLKWWEGVDMHLMPGTTADDRVRESMFFDRYWFSSKDFVGGAALEGQFLTASMDLESFHCEVDEGRPDRGYGRSFPIHKCSLTAKKSWFMMDRVVVAVGTDVNANDGYGVRTVIENRKLRGTVLVNGEPLSVEPGEMVREDVKSIYIPGAGGYFFPQGGRIALRVYGEEGAKYIACWFAHGVNPENGSYAYIVLPNATAEEYAAYDISDVEILANDGEVQAVREKHSGLTGVVFREAGAFTDIIADQPMIVMTQKTEEGIRLVACDPTQKREGFGLTVLGAKAAECGWNVTAEAAADGVKLNVVCDSSRGRGYRATLK